MNGWNRDPQPYPGGGTWMAQMPLLPPERPVAPRKANRRSGVPHCEACAENGSRPCHSHATVDVLRTVDAGDS